MVPPGTFIVAVKISFITFITWNRSLESRSQELLSTEMQLLEE